MSKYKFPTWAALAVAMSLPLSGCFWVTTKSEGKALRTDLSALDGRVATKEASLDGKVKELQGILDEATRVLKRNSADLGADVQANQDELRQMRGLITAAKTYADEVRAEVETLKKTIADQYESRIASLEARLAAIESKPSTKTPDELWNEAKTAFDAKDNDTAIKLFRAFVVQFPSHAKADDAQYNRGEAYFRTGDYDGAIREFQKVFDTYADGDLADDALYRAGEAALKLKRCSEARAYFGLLRQKYPKSTLFKKSQDQDKSIKANMKNAKICTG